MTGALWFALCVGASVHAASINDGSKPDYETIVIGLGASGITAASELARAGVKVLGLEAMDRIGGRVNTVRFGDGVVEMGAEWIHGTVNSRTYDLAIKNSVDLIDQDTHLEFFYSNGSSLPSDTRSLMNKLVEAGMEAAGDSVAQEPLGQYLTRKMTAYIKENYPQAYEDKEFVAEYLHFLDMSIDTLESSYSWNDISTGGNYEELEGSQSMSWHKYGYKTLFDILLNKYKNGTGLPTLTMKLNSEVTNIAYSDNPSQKVAVTTKDGSTYTADNVIITVSVGVLKANSIAVPGGRRVRTPVRTLRPPGMVQFGCSFIAISVTNIAYSDDPSQKVTVTAKDGSTYTADNVIMTLSVGVLKANHKSLFSSPLPQAKLSAIDLIPMGLLGKVVFLFPEHWWQDTQHPICFLWRSEDKKQVAEEDKWFFNISGTSTPMGSHNALTVWTYGQTGRMVEAMDEEVVKSKFMGLLRRFMGKGIDIPEPIAMMRTTWFHNPYTRGSYSFDSIVVTQHPTLRKDLSEPITDSAGNPRVLFAGEATEPEHYATVHGATNTGHREAARLLERRAKAAKAA